MRVLVIRSIWPPPREPSRSPSRLFSTPSRPAFVRGSWPVLVICHGCLLLLELLYRPDGENRVDTGDNIQGTNSLEVALHSATASVWRGSFHSSECFSHNTIAIIETYTLYTHSALIAQAVGQQRLP